MASFRPLQPAPIDQEPGSTQQDLPPRSQGKPESGQSQKPKRSVTLGACAACRKRKSKCDGTRPICTCCDQKGTLCLYELEPHEKPSQALKRKLTETHGEVTDFRDVFDSLRLGPEPEAFELFKRIRRTAPGTSPTRHIQELANSVRQCDPVMEPCCSPAPSPPQYTPEPVTLPPIRMALDSLNLNTRLYSNSLPFPTGILSMDSQTRSQRRRHDSHEDVSGRPASQGPLPRISIKDILQEPSTSDLHEPTDPRLSTAINWTNVTNDVDLIISLLTTWHTSWENRYYHFLDWDLFLDDMANGKTNFCSSLLVNSLLSSASFLTSKTTDRSNPFADNHITRFYREAKRLWDLEEGKDCLTRLQAAPLLFLVFGKNGRDKAGHEFLVEACRMAQDLGLFRVSTSVQIPEGVSEEQWLRGRAVAAWSLFNFQLLMSFTYSLPAILKSQPPLPIPYDDPDVSTALFRSECTRQIIMLDVSSILRDSDNDFPPKPEQVEVLIQRLKVWWNSRIPSLNTSRNPAPENILADMVYHTSIIRLVQQFLNRDSALERIKFYCDRAHHLFSSSLREIRRLLILHEVVHGWKKTVPYIMHPLMVAGFGSLEEITSQKPSHLLTLEPSEPYQGLLSVLRALSNLSSFIYYAQPLFRLLTQSCQTLGIPLPIEILNTLEFYRSEEWTKTAEQAVSSRYVADTRSKADKDLESRRMDCVIKQWGSLTMALESRNAVNSEVGDGVREETES